MFKNLETAFRGLRGITLAVLAAGVLAACGGGGSLGVARDDSLEAANSTSPRTDRKSVV